MLLQLQLEATVPVVHVEATLRKRILQRGRERLIRPNLQYGLKRGGKVAQERRVSRGRRETDG